MNRTASQYLQEDGKRILNSFRSDYGAYPTTDEKRTLRPFSIKDASKLLGLNINAMRHVLRSNPDTLPQGFIYRSNHRYFAAEDINKIRNFLINNDRLPEKHITRPIGNEGGTSIISCANFVSDNSPPIPAATLLVNLSLRGYKCLAIDMCAQASLTTMLGITPWPGNGLLTIYDVVRDPRGTTEQPASINDAIIKTHVPGLHILPSDININLLELEAKGAFESRGLSALIRRVRFAVDTIKDEYSVILINCSPTNNFVNYSAIHASNALLAPISASVKDVHSLLSFLARTTQIEKVSRSIEFNWVRYLLTNFDRLNKSQLQIASTIRASLGNSVLNTELPSLAAINDIIKQNRTLIEFDPKHFERSTYEIAMDSHDALTSEIEVEIQKSWGRKSSNA